MLCARSFPLDENPLLCHYYKKSPSNFLIITRIHQCLTLHVCLSSNSITRKADSGLHRFNVLLFLHPKEQYSETKIWQTSRTSTDQNVQFFYCCRWISKALYKSTLQCTKPYTYGNIRPLFCFVVKKKTETYRKRPDFLNRDSALFQSFFASDSIFQILEVLIVVFLWWRILRIYRERFAKRNRTFNLKKQTHKDKAQMRH